MLKVMERRITQILNWTRKHHNFAAYLPQQRGGNTTKCQAILADGICKSDDNNLCATYLRLNAYEKKCLGELHTDGCQKPKTLGAAVEDDVSQMLS